MGWLKITSTLGSSFSATKISVSLVSSGWAVNSANVAIHSAALALGKLCMPRWKDCLPYGAVHSTESGIWRALGTERSSMGALMLSWSVIETMGATPISSICLLSRSKASLGVIGGVQ